MAPAVRHGSVQRPSRRGGCEAPAPWGAGWALPGALRRAKRVPEMKVIKLLRTAITASVSLTFFGTASVSAFDLPSVETVVAFCSQPSPGPKGSRSAFERRGWTLASEEQAFELREWRAAYATISSWQKGTLPYMAQAMARLRSNEAGLQDFGTLTDAELFKVVLDRDTASDEPRRFPTISPVSVTLNTPESASARLLISFSENGRSGWKQTCSLYSLDGSKAARTLAAAFKDSLPTEFDRVASGKFELPPVSDDPTAVSPKGRFFLTDAAAIENSLNISLDAHAMIEISLSIAPPAEITADEANQ